MGASSSTSNFNGSKSWKDGSARRFTDHFELGKVLGEGAFGVVHTCVRNEDSEEFAVKISKKGVEVSELKSEVKMMKTLSHDNIVGFHGVFHEKGAVCIVMTKCGGGDLINGLHYQQEHKVRIAGSDIVHVCRQMAAAIQYIHSCNVVHRDVKGDNFLIDRVDILDPACRVALTDFGIAKKVADNERLKDEAGTRRFWAPEMYARNYGFKVDVWAMGVIIYGLIEGRFPFKDGHAILTQDPKYPDDMQPDFADFLKGMFEKKERNRYSADAVAHHRWLKPKAQPKSVAPCFQPPQGKCVRFSDSPGHHDASTLPAGWMQPAAPVSLSGSGAPLSNVEKRLQFAQVGNLGYPHATAGMQKPTLLAGTHAMRMAKYSQVAPQMGQALIDQR